MPSARHGGGELTLPALPGWLEELLPEPKTPIVMSLVDGELLRLRYPDGREDTFDRLPAAHEAARQTDWDLFVADEVFEHYDDGRMMGQLTYPSGRDGFVTMVISWTDGERHEALQRDYQDFVKIAAAYEADPRDFYLAWRFIDRHPAFWTAYDLDGHPWHWETDGYCSKLTQTVWRRDEELGRGGVGPVIVSVAAGGHVPEDKGRGHRYKDHYADWQLEVDASTFEEAILLLAGRVELCFERDGTPKPEEQIPLEKPGWVTTLESRIAELDE